MSKNRVKKTSDKAARHARHNRRMGLPLDYAGNITVKSAPNRIVHAEKPGKGALYHRPILSHAEALAMLSRHAREVAEAKQGMRAVLSGD